MRYEIDLILPHYVTDGEDYVRKEVTKRVAFSDWDDVQNFLGYMIGGSEGRWTQFDIRAIREVMDEQ